MRCDMALSVLLEADLEELRKGHHAAAEHAARCATCARALDRILAAEGALDGWLGEAPRPDTRTIVARVDAEDGSAPSGKARRRSGARIGTWVALAAAAVAAVFLVRDPGPPTSGALDRSLSPAGMPEPGATAAATLAGNDTPGRPAAPDIAVPAGRNAAILRTGNPDITVIWFYGGDS